MDPLPGPIHADGIGSIRRLTDEAGTITDGYTYSAFGELLAHTGSDLQPYAFTGEPYDPNSGFQYHRARWMDPSIGILISVDPHGGDTFDPSSLHRYLYAGSDPTNKIDPTGRFSLSTFTITSGVLTTLNAVSLAHLAWTASHGAGSIANRLLIEETIEFEEAVEEARELTFKVGGEALLRIEVRP